MTMEELFIKSLESEMQRAGYECSRHPRALRLPSLGLEVITHDQTVEEAMEEKAASAIFEARAIGATTTGISVFQLGFGLTEFDAACDASYQWCLGVYPALLNYIAEPEHCCEVETARMIVRDAESGEEFGWTIHLPPILSRAYGEAELPEKLEQQDVFHALFETIHPYAAHNQLLWLECFAARVSDSKVSATCRLNNDDWEEGQDALLQWALSWPPFGKGILSHRQFLLFEPTPIEQIPGRESMSKAMEDYFADQSATA
jgi:hypothetical protein